MHSLRARAECSSGYLYYTCDNGFAGCCATNPCSPLPGCPAESLQPPPTLTTTTKSSTRTIKSRDDDDTTTTFDTMQPTDTGSSDSSSTDSSNTTTDAPSSPTSTDATLSTTSTDTSTPTSIALAPSSDGDSDSSNIGPILGGVIGGILLLIILAALVYFGCRRRRVKARNMSNATLSRRPDMQPIESDRPSGIFQPYGGFYRGKDETENTPHHSAEPSIIKDDRPYSFVDSYVSQNHEAASREVSQISPVSPTDTTHDAETLRALTSPHPAAYPSELDDTSSPVSPMQNGTGLRRWTHLTSIPLHDSPTLGTESAVVAGAITNGRKSSCALGSNPPPASRDRLSSIYRPYRAMSIPNPPVASPLIDPTDIPTCLSAGPRISNRGNLGHPREGGMISIANSMRKESDPSEYNPSPEHGPPPPIPAPLPQLRTVHDQLELRRSGTKLGVRRSDSGKEKVMSWMEYSPYEAHAPPMPSHTTPRLEAPLPPLPAAESRLSTEEVQLPPMKLSPTLGQEIAATNRGLVERQKSTKDAYEGARSGWGR